MPPERWRRIEELYHAARQRELSKRGAYLSEACPDSEMRREVEALLTHNSGTNVLDGPAWEVFGLDTLGPAVSSLSPRNELGQTALNHGWERLRKHPRKTPLMRRAGIVGQALSPAQSVHTQERQA